MPKARRDQSSKKGIPYSRSKASTKKNDDLTTIKKSTKPITKSERIKNAKITDQLDDLMNDFSPQLLSKKEKKKNQKLPVKDIDAEQREYEKTQNDMEDALSLLTRL
ncbi:hypothetical protein DFQ28_000024 [Apophysomyces sp. BC1034]|nr:hypothetical protein DFQ30_005465 [Apophysomyces sp. BC1015]KAG0182784.1 hypothetical protein DFQ29_002196 [Apophysomyces sp. BC1021]KAG0194925.1 hypothetical protein DFQ28_000024 [Apophysomyces sp. BC1034]